MRVLGWAACCGFLVAALGVLLAVLSGFGYQWGWWELRSVAFVMLRWGATIALAGAVISLIGVIVSWPGKGRRGFPYALAGLLIGGAAFLIPYHQLQVVYSLPFIHDISTDMEAPPAFVALAEVKAETENGVEYGGPEIADQQREAYPDLIPLEFDRPVEVVFGEAVSAARSMGWEIAEIAPAEGRIEATDTTFWFGFKDDVVIRVQALGEAAGGEEGEAASSDDEAEGDSEAVAAARTRVDVRSMSRVGKSDVGVNARRIRNYSRTLIGLVRAAP